MSSKLNVESFVAVLKKSGLIEADRLQRLVSEFTAQGGSPDDSNRLADFLVANNAITRWQSEKLLQGKHKGYFLGKYRLLSLLGKGGMSSVYLAEHVLMRRRCALKVLPTKRVNDSSYLARFHREAQAVASLDHPNIVRAYDVDHQQERDTEIHFLVMEYVEGLSLQDLVQKQGVCSFLDSAEYIRQAALGLQSAHEAGMVHRDVKPGNLLVDPNGVVKVLDLGLARFFTGDEGEDALTIRHDEKVLGTADYLAPEQALDSHTVDARADLYSLGCTWYFILTGRPPFTEGTLAQRLMAHQSKTPPTVESLRPETPISLANIVRKMMSKNPDDRYRTAKEAADTLFAWIDANADPEWRKAHSGIFGTRSSEVSTERASIPVAKPIIAIPIAPAIAPLVAPVIAPVATPVVAPVVAHVAAPTPAPVIAPAPVISPPAGAEVVTVPPPPEPQFVPFPVDSAVESTTAVDSEFSNFLAAMSDTQNVVPKPAPTPSKPPIKQSAPSVAAPPKPPAAQSGTTSAAAVKPPSSKSLKQPVPAPVQFTSEPNFLNFETTPATPVAKTPKSSITAPSPARKLPTQTLSTPILAGIGGGVLIVALVVAYLLGWFGGNGKSSSSTLKVAWTEETRETTVGNGKENKTISEALKKVRRFFNPNGTPTDQFVIKISAGTYRENLNIDGTMTPIRRRDKKSDKPVEPDWPQGIKLLADGEVILQAVQDAPAIRLKNISKLIIEGIEVRANSQPVAIDVTGDMNDSRLSGMKISGFTEVGVRGNGASGIPFGEGHYFIMENLTFEPSPDAKAATGIRMTSTNEGDASDAIIRGCQFLGPLASGVIITGVAPNRIIISEDVFYKTQDGIRFEGNTQWKDIAVRNSTFYECNNGILFTHHPQDGSRGLSFRRNLFSKTATTEGAIQTGFDEGRLAGMLLAGPPGIEFNYSDRPKPPSPASTEIRNLCVLNGKQGETGLAFASTTPTDKKFLAPTDPSVQRNVPGAGEGEKNWVGAIGPK